MMIRKLYWNLIGHRFFNKKKYIRNGFKNDNMTKLFFLALATEMLDKFKLDAKKKAEIESLCQSVDADTFSVSWTFY